MYLEVVYKAPQRWFHMFESEYGMAGLSFADEMEGDSFRTMVNWCHQLVYRRRSRQAESTKSGKGSTELDISGKYLVACGEKTLRKSTNCFQPQTQSHSFMCAELRCLPGEGWRL